MSWYLVSIVLVAAAVLPASAAEELLAGTGAADITPPLGYRMSGYFHERLNEGTSNPLLAKAIVLKQGDARAAMVFCDIIGLSLDVSSRARKAAAVKTGIPAANILVAATHSHTGPLYAGALRKHFHDLAVAEHGSDPQEKVDYPARLVAGIVDAVAEADAAARPVTLAAGSARQEGLSFNRRFHMKDGSVRFNPGVQNPDIVRVAGPTDPAVGVVVARGADDGKERAVLVNFALHLDTVGGTKYAADYPFFLQEVLGEKFGDQVMCLFGTGTCGDINHIDVTQRDRLQTDHIGRTLGRTVAAAVPKLPTVAPDLAVRHRVVQAPLQRWSPEDIAWAQENIQKVGTRELPFLEQVKAYTILANQLRGGTSLPLEVQVFRLTPTTAVVGLPGEIFVDLGLAIKQASPFETTFVIELCNDAPGYIPTTKAFKEGSYETVNSRIAPGGGEMLVAAATELLEALAPPRREK